MKERFGCEAKHPIISLNHAILYQRPGVYGERTVASKQRYATHYSEASLGLTVMVEDREAGKPCFYLMHINRSRVDIMREIPEFLAKCLFKGTHKLLYQKMAVVKKTWKPSTEKPIA